MVAWHSIFQLCWCIFVEPKKHCFNYFGLFFPFFSSAICEAEEVVPEEDDNEENPFSTEFLEDQEAAYLKDPKKALQGFYDREGEMVIPKVAPIIM